MVTAPLFIIFAIALFCMVKWGGTHPGVLAMGALFGLSLASTTFGAPILDGMETAMTSALSAVSNIAGGAR
ncbi:hypothetical protein ABTX24_13480 [Nocardioides sp. NPDC127514]|uniref:hypothetical protein n=1 Tax=unclassified Nocardioides TaxID=2615069 RepID=UPI0033311590